VSYFAYDSLLKKEKVLEFVTNIKKDVTFLFYIGFVEADSIPYYSSLIIAGE